MRLYSIKHALTVGITEVWIDTERASYADLGDNPKRGDYLFTQGEYCCLRFEVDCFRTAPEAEKAAKEMAARKCVSLQKQLAKVRPLVTTPKWKGKK